MKTINLDKIIDDELYSFKDEEGDPCYYKWQLKEFAKILCKKVLELAAENAKAYDPIHSWNIPVVDKKSITNTLNQII